jgi:cellulose synthase (UDP-forming)
VHKLTGRTKGWVATGTVAKGKKSSLARSISLVGIVTLSVTLGVSWAAFAWDVSIYGWGDYWTMALFLAGYSYLGIPLLAGFVQVQYAGSRLQALVRSMPRRRALSPAFSDLAES